VLPRSKARAGTVAVTSTLLAADSGMPNESFQKNS